MKKNVDIIIQRMEEVFSGDPWYGKSVMSILNAIDPEKVYIRPVGHAHSLMDLLFHMLNWQEFALRQLLDGANINLEIFQALDWRDTSSTLYTWENGIAELKAIHDDLIRFLRNAGDELLERQVSFRDYRMDYLLNGLIDHNIYHTGQLAYLAKLLS